MQMWEWPRQKVGPQEGKKGGGGRVDFKYIKMLEGSGSEEVHRRVEEEVGI